LVRVAYKKGICSIYIEAGAQLFGRLLKDRLVDRCHIYIAPKFVGDGKKMQVDLAIDKMDDALKFDHFSSRQIGDSLFIEGKFKKCSLD
ncbi:MAG: dihydrofolate reductase family protein, partial [Calditrichaeota bacterium]|nr:dihydrofolate reductase family protein [Calditrichota bacterium]